MAIAFSILIVSLSLTLGGAAMVKVAAQKVLLIMFLDFILILWIILFNKMVLRGVKHQNAIVAHDSFIVEATVFEYI